MVKKKISVKEKELTEKTTQKFSIITGWSCIEELANEVYSSTHFGLLCGNLIYAFKSQEFPRLVITQRQDTGDFMVGEVTPGWTAYYPRVPYQFLITDILDDMKKLKLSKETIDNYILVIKEYENFSN